MIFLEISKSNRIVPKGLYVKKDFFSAEIFIKGILLYLAKGKFDYQWRLCDSLIQENDRELFQLKVDFGQVVRITKVNNNFLSILRFHPDRVQKKQDEIKKRKLRSLSPNSVYKKLLIDQFYKHLPH